MLSGGAAPFAGTTRFEVIHELGAGAMGVVYAARDREAGVSVALKTLRNVDAKSLARFKQEFRALADMTHPNLVRLGELFSEEGQWFFSMELVVGRDFLSHVRIAEDPTEASLEIAAGRDASSGVARAYDEVRLRGALLQLALGVSALHAAGKVHRDIKPHNILVDTHGRVILLDFGLVTEVRSAGAGQEGLLGTPKYMAPEQAAQEAVGPAADWYAVGVVLFEALTGRAPFLGTHAEILARKKELAAPSPKEFGRDASEDLCALCDELLRRDPAARPSGRDVLLRLGVDPEALDTTLIVASASSQAGGARFVGRAPELSLLERAFRDRVGGAVTVFLHGESGIGKSALVRHFCDTLAAREPSAWILSSRCHERERMPYKAFDGIVEELALRLCKPGPEMADLRSSFDAALLSLLFPALRRAEAVDALARPLLPDLQELRTRAFAQLRMLLTHVAKQFPLVLCIDDLQWADADSWVLLRDVLHGSDAPPFVLLCTVQMGVSVPAHDLGRIRELFLSPLAEMDSLALVSELLGKKADHADVISIAREAAGHPLFLGELAHEVRFSGGQKQTLLLEEIMALRVQALPADARRLVELLAVAAAPLSRKAAALAADMDASPLDRALALLRVGHLCRVTGKGDNKGLEMYHNRIRGAVRARLPALRVTEHHARLARALEVTGEDPAGLILHLEAAGEKQRAAVHAETVADLAHQGLAFSRAATFYRKALEFGEPTKERVLRVKLADALAKAGRGAEAAAEFLRAVPGAPAAEVLDLRRRATDQYLRSGHIDEGLESARAVLLEVGLTMPPTHRRALLALLLARARLRLRGLGFRVRDGSQVSPNELARIDVCSALGVCLGFAYNIEGAAFQAQALLYALDAGEPARLIQALVKEAFFVSTRGLPARARTDHLLSLADGLLGGLDQPELRAWIVGVRGFATYLCGQFRTAQAHEESAERILRERCVGVAWEIDSTQLVHAWSLYYQGSLTELARRVPSLLVEAESRGDLHLAANLCLSKANAAWLVVDDTEKAQAQARSAIEQRSHRGYQLWHYWYTYAEAQISLYLGHGAEAWQRVVADGRGLRNSLLSRAQLVRIEYTDLRGRAALATALESNAEREPALRSAAKDARRLRRDKTPWGNALATLLEAGVAAQRGDRARASALYADAAAQFDQVDMALHAAVARLRQGELMGGDSGKALVTSAQAWFASQTVKNPARWAQMIAPGPGAI